MRRLGLGVALSFSIAGALLACGASRLPAPPYAAQPTEALQEVAYPPPPARVEYVPPAPKDGAVWIDGEWTWQGTRWAWKRGRWVMPPASAVYSPWASARDRQGNLYVAEGKWRDKQQHDLPDPPALAVGRTRGGAVTNPEGEPVPAAPNVPVNAPPSTGRGKAVEGSRHPETPSGATPTGTEPTTPPIIPDAGEPSDAGLVDIGLDDSMRAPDVVPLDRPLPRSGALSSPRMDIE
jgi:hypothetical protein